MALYFGVAIVAVLLSGVAGSAYYHYTQLSGVINFYHLALAFFLTLNVLVCLWEIGLGLYIKDIKKYYENTLLKKYPSRTEHFGATVNVFLHRMSLGELFSLKFWSERVWGTYSLYDPSYSNHESYGFFIDVGNGWSTLLVSMYFLVGMTDTSIVRYTYSVERTDTQVIDPLFFGMMGIIFFYQMFYGTIIYFVQFIYHGRYKGRTVFEVALFVGLNNGLWILFPLMGMYCSATMIRSNSFDIVRKNHY